MRKRLGLGILLLSLAGIGYAFVADTSSIIRVHLNPTTFYIDGKEMVPSDRKGFYYDGKRYVPAALEYEGTVYVPVNLVGKQINKQVSWDKSTHSVWIGDPPPPPVPPASQVAKASASAAQRTAPAASESAEALFGITLGMNQQQVTSLLGQPARKDPSALGYEWWIYNQNPSRYLQVGIWNGKVVDVYSNAPEAKWGSLGIGASLQTLTRKQEIKPTITFAYQGAQVQIVNQTKERPLILSGGTPLIFYIDKQNDHKVTGIRLIDKLMLLRGGYYETRWTYQGKEPNFDPPALTIKQQEQIDAAHERQILDLVNVIRFRYKLPKLVWNQQAAQAARNHSKDMESHNYFDHVSATTGLDPFERLKQAGIPYKMAGENIAAGYPDAIEAFEGWMNSLGHRKNVLEKGFTQVGVGVATDYYTQAFVTLQ
jgi:uncharacterized protein YkwD